MDAVIQVDGLEKTYGDGTKAVKGISFTVRKGEIFGLLGPNGAGKTTAMRILGTLHRQTAGTARVLGLDVATQGDALRQRIGFAMQEVGMDDLATAREMLVLHAQIYGMSAKQAKAKAEELLTTFGLREHADRRVTRFSGGMQRRLDLAVSLAHEPEVLFLDEPSTGLDPKSRSDLWRVLRELRDRRGITILMSTHYMEEADVLCDRIAVMNDGRIAAIDTPANLKRSVGADHLRIALGEHASTPQKEAVVRAFGPANVRFENQHLMVRVKDGGRSLLPALRIVSDAGLQVVETQVKSPNLDDVFLRYTGLRMEEAAKKTETDGDGAPPAKRERGGA